MGRLSQAIGFMNVNPSELTGLWKKYHLTKIDIEPNQWKKSNLWKLRSERLKEIREDEKQCDTQINIF